MIEQEMTEDLFAELPDALELAKYLTGVYKDPESSSFETTQAAVGLSSFWLGCELSRASAIINRLVILPADAILEERQTQGEGLL